MIVAIFLFQVSFSVQVGLLSGQKILELPPDCTKRDILHHPDLQPYLRFPFKFVPELSSNLEDVVTVSELQLVMLSPLTNESKGLVSDGEGVYEIFLIKGYPFRIRLPSAENVSDGFSFGLHIGFGYKKFVHVMCNNGIWEGRYTDENGIEDLVIEVHSGKARIYIPHDEEEEIVNIEQSYRALTYSIANGSSSDLLIE